MVIQSENIRLHCQAEWLYYSNNLFFVLVMTFEELNCILRNWLPGNKNPWRQERTTNWTSKILFFNLAYCLKIKKCHPWTNCSYWRTPRAIYPWSIFFFEYNFIYFETLTTHFEYNKNFKLMFELHLILKFIFFISVNFNLVKI